MNAGIFVFSVGGSDQYVKLIDAMEKRLVLRDDTLSC